MLSRHVDPQLLAFVEDQLPRDDRRRVADHLAACARCRARRDELALGRQLARRLAPAAPLPAARAAALRATVRAALRERTAPRPAALRQPASWQQASWQQASWRWAATAAAVLLLLIGGSYSSGLMAAEDWPQWRGPARDGKSPDTGLLKSWPEGGPPLLWQTSGIGSGYASVSVAGGRIFTMGDLADGQYVFALSQADGKQQWKVKVGPRWEDQYLGPRATPTVDGDRVYAMSTEGELVCLDAARGNVVWKRSLPADFGGSMMKAKGTYDWKFSESPLVDGERVIVTPGAQLAALVALDKKNGREVWRAPLPPLGERGADGAAYSSVMISEGGGVRQYVQLVGRGVIGVEAATGKPLWGYNRVANEVANIPTPIVSGNYVFASTGYGTGAALLELLPKAGGGVEAREVYFLEGEVMQNHHGGMILHDGYVYTGTGHNKGLPLAVEMKTGKVAWGPIRNAGQSSAALAFADGMLYFRYQNGLMVLVEATPAEYRERGSFMIPNVERESWPHPVIAGGRLYLREQDRLYVYDVRAPKS